MAARSPSWELRTDDGTRLHVLLHIRDVAALEVPADGDAPPLLTGLPPRRSPVRDADERRQAGRDWAEWGARAARGRAAGAGPPDRLHGREFFRWEWVRDSAEGVAAEHGVSPGGGVTVLDVEGVWWRRVAPGAVLCSTAATEAPRTATTVLRGVFASGLR